MTDFDEVPESEVPRPPSAPYPMAGRAGRARAERDRLRRDELMWLRAGNLERAVGMRLAFVATFRGRELRTAMLAALDEYERHKDPVELAHLVRGFRSLLMHQRRWTRERGFRDLWKFAQAFRDSEMRVASWRALAGAREVDVARHPSAQAAVEFSTTAVELGSPGADLEQQVERMKMLLGFVPSASESALRALQDEMLDALAGNAATARVVTAWVRASPDAVARPEVRDAIDLVFTAIVLDDRVSDEVRSEAAALQGGWASGPVGGVPHFPHADRGVGSDGSGRVGDRGAARSGWA